MHSLLRVSDAVNLAMHSVAILAEEPDRLVSARELAARLDASEATLSKAMQRLVKTGIVLSTRGPAGGFRLGRAPGQVSLKEIVEAVEGPISSPGCLFGRQICGRNECILGDSVRLAHEILLDRLETTKLDQVAIGLRGAVEEPVGRRRRKEK